MSRPFDMQLFLAGVLTGSHATRQRHIHQAKTIQAAIAGRWQRDNPWTWQRKHLVWFLRHHLDGHAESTRYYYLLTVQLIAKRLGKAWQFNRSTRWPQQLASSGDHVRVKKPVLFTLCANCAVDRPAVRRTMAG